MRLRGKIALVTGAGSGLGKVIAVTFAREGAALIVNDVDQESAERVVAECGRSDPPSMAIKADVSDSDAVRSMFATVRKKYPTLDILVNNAGVVDTKEDMDRMKVIETYRERFASLLAGQPRPPWNILCNITDPQWRRMISVHLDGTFYCTREALRIMQEKRCGKIINMASVAGTMGLELEPHYSAAKAGIIGLTKAVAREVADLGIHVNAIAPGFIRTPLLKDIPEDILETITKLIPAGTMGEPADIAMAALYLACDESSYLVGQTISPNGGAWMM
jgi:3-oxoacyl-[acyl-carrier protein] reductase